MIRVALAFHVVLGDEDRDLSLQNPMYVYATI